MKAATSSPQDQEIIEILKRLETHKAEYPQELFAARRAAFIAQIDEKFQEGEEEESVPEPQVLAALEGLKNIPEQYPSELLASRREAFLAQVRKQKEIGVQEEWPSKAQVMEVLEAIKASPAKYPSELLAARRAAFLAQIAQHNQTVETVEEELVPTGTLAALMGRLKSIEIDYPWRLWTARRTAFLNQMGRERISILDALYAGIRDIWHQLRTPQAPVRRLMRSSFVLAALLIAAIVGSVYFSDEGGASVSQAPAQTIISQSMTATSTTEPPEVICKPGYLPPLCLAQEFDKAQDLTFQGNGSARPAVAKDTLPGYNEIHRASYINDGLYGAGASWISNSAYSWIKIDLGKPTTINTITFGRDRLGNFNDRDPGQFVIAVALSDNIYADGDSSLDFFEYKPVYDSKKAGFDGLVAGSETIEASFVPVEARYVKITFQNQGTAIDEVEAFMVQPPSLAYVPTDRTRDNQPRPTWTPVPTDTLIPSKTPTRIPTRTSTTIPTNTPVPTDTNTPVPPTDTPLPPTDTPVPPTDTPVPPTDTPVPPTDVPPTDTSVPATEVISAQPTTAPTDMPTAIAP